MEVHIASSSLKQGIELAVGLTPNEIGVFLLILVLPFGKIKFDLGANFIHGTDRNPLTDIAKKVESTFVDSISLRRYYDRDGKALSDETSALIYRKVWEYSDAASDYSRENDVDKNESVEDFCKERLEKDKEVKGKAMKELVGDAMKMFANISACNLDKLSLKYFWMEDDLPVYPYPEPAEEILGR